jgi:hypothetical protein
MNSIVDFQAQQDAHGRLRILVVQREMPSCAQDRERMADAFDRTVEPPAPTVVERVDRIPLTPGGKLRTIVAAAT